MQKRYQTLITVAEFEELRGNDQVVIFDSRFYLNDTSKGRIEYLQGHIPGAVYLDVNHDLSSPAIKGITGRHPLPHPEILASTLRAAGLNNGTQVIAYDHANGANASRIWWLLRWLGHVHVAVLDGGFAAWNEAHLPIDNQCPLPPRGNFESHISDHMTVEMKTIGDMSNPLIDSREYKRYIGEFEPIDPVAGHIPGAVCIPYIDNTDKQGLWKSAEELKIRFTEIETSQTEPVFYCGSGVTACHNILAYKISTGKDALLYAGSWSEWIHFNKVEK